MAPRKVPVSLRAVIQRINRKLKPDLRGLRASRGQYHVIDFNRNAVILENADLEGYARKLGVLEEWEEVSE